MRERMKRTGATYAAIPNAALRDDSISMEARGLLALLMTYSDDWTFNKAHLLAVTGWGRDKFEKHMGELRAAQYVELTQDRDAMGRVQGSTWIIRDEGSRGPENQGVGVTEALKNRALENPSAGKSGPIRRTKDKENQKEETQTLFGDLPVIASQAEQTDPFDDFWAAYPNENRQRKTDRPKARQVFYSIVQGRHKTIPKTNAETIINGIKGYAATDPDPLYIPLPTTWLNGARWNATPVPPTNGPSGGVQPTKRQVGSDWWGSRDLN